MQDESLSSTLPQRKMSRYRTQRVSAISPPPPPMPQSDVVARSRSRYHAKAASSRSPLKSDGYDSPPPNGYNTQARSDSQSDPPLSSGSAHSQRSPLEREAVSQQQLDRTRYPAHRVDSGTTLQSSDSYQNIHNGLEDRFALAQTQSRSPPPDGKLFPPMRPPTPQDMDGPPRSDPRRAVKNGSGEMQSTLLQHFDGPPQSHQIRATKSALPISPTEEKDGLFKMFRRKHARHSSVEEKTAADARTNIQKPVSVGAEAPISAVNAGERRVLVECGKTKLMFPVTPTTTSVDLIKSASNTMTESINVRSAVMLEYFMTVGVHRPIRRYEHIRDIMNSWDSDTQNTLLIIDPGVGKAEEELNLAGVPKHKPKDDRQWSLHYSQTVGKWDKRGIILKADGQILMMKDPRRPTDLIKVCRLSDFDIYTPTPEKAKKKIKPPKKHCVAIKSQQKSSMFESTANFVHFFCTDDAAAAHSFHAAVQSWRSWYLVNVMGEGKSAPSQLLTPTKAAGPVSDTSRAHRRNDTIGSHYQLGTFSPLLNVDQFGNGAAQHSSSHQSTVHAHRPQSREHANQTSGRTAGPMTAHLADDEPLANLGRRLSIKPGHGTQIRADQLPQAIKSRDGQSARAHGRPLIDSATSPSEVTAAPLDSLGNVAGRDKAIKDAASFQQAASHRPGRESDQAFTGEGLLAAGQGQWGTGTRGRGIMDGSHATGPMVDMSTSSEFAKGSLLRKVEAQQGVQQYPTANVQKYI